MGGQVKGFLTVVASAMGIVALVAIGLEHSKGTGSVIGGTASSYATVAKTFQGRN